MLNEFVYCPRLFYLEWAQARWADNLDTEQGRWHHRAVEGERGRVPPPASTEELYEATSVLVSSERLGLVARVDLLERGADGSVVPVDTKRGRAPDVPEGAREPERVQLCAQGLLLRENGYRCDRGVLYFADSRERVEITFDEALIGRTLELLRELRTVVARDAAPAPLVDSPKCPRCSLVSICLPDETNLLTHRSRRTRRLVPHDKAARPLYVTEQGAYLGKNGGRIEVRKDRAVMASVRLIDVSHVSVFGNVQVGTQLLRELFSREIPVCWFSYGGWFAGVAEGLPSKHVDLRRRQVVVASQGGLLLAARMVEGKIRNARTLLRRNTSERDERVLDQLKALADECRTAPSIASLLGFEGTAARLYFQHFSTMLRADLRLPGTGFSLALRD